MNRMLRSAGTLAAAFFLLTCCNVQPGAPDPGASPVIAGEGRPPIDYPAVDDNVRHDTLLIQTTFDLRDGTYVMVASNVADTFEGLRLYHYRPRPDSSAEVLAVSAPAYDSWTMLPTFFRADSTEDRSLWVLANFGEKESWGQKVMRFVQGFNDVGFMDVALPERVMEDDTLRLKRRNIGPFVRCSEQGGLTFFRFACDSVFLYDDLAGRMDVVVPARSVHYTLDQQGRLVLWMDGKPRLPDEAA